MFLKKTVLGLMFFSFDHYCSDGNPLRNGNLFCLEDSRCGKCLKSSRYCIYPSAEQYDHATLTELAIYENQYIKREELYVTIISLDLLYALSANQGCVSLPAIMLKSFPCPCVDPSMVYCALCQLGCHLSLWLGQGCLRGNHSMATKWRIKRLAQKANESSKRKEEYQKELLMNKRAYFDWSMEKLFFQYENGLKELQAPVVAVENELRAPATQLMIDSPQRFSATDSNPLSLYDLEENDELVRVIGRHE